jgi:surface polysaccharide O-acyltransferase-like enzyme
LLTYLLLLIFSYVLGMDERFGQAIDKGKGMALAVAVVTDLVYSAHDIGTLSPEFPKLFARWPAFIWPEMRALCAWCSLMAVLGYARQYLRAARPILAYASQAVLPFYMLHQTLIIIIAYFIRDWALAVGLKYLFVVCSTFAVCMGVYEFAIRRNRVLRFRFGMPV